MASLAPPLVHRILLAVLPAFVIGAVVLSTIWGDNGWLRRMELQAELDQANADLRETQRQNARMLREIRVLEQDPVAAERQVAEELEWAREGTRLYRFEDGDGAEGDSTRNEPLHGSGAGTGGLGSP